MILARWIIGITHLQGKYRCGGKFSCSRNQHISVVRKALFEARVCDSSMKGCRNTCYTSIFQTIRSS
jgi:hypothetical protein